MKNILNKMSTLLVTASLLFGCTSDFDSIDQKPYAFTDEELKQDFNHYRLQFVTTFLNVFKTPNGYQLQQNLNGDIFSGYMASPTPFRGGINNSTYALVDPWSASPWGIAYENIMPNVFKISKYASESAESTRDIEKSFEQLANIIRVVAMHRLSDQFGPIRYTKFKNVETTGVYDTQKEVYEAFFDELNTAINSLESMEGNNFFASFDMSTAEGNINTWRKFANTLRLRLAIRVSNVDPELAKTQGELALSNNAGFLEEPFIINTGYTHPIQKISNNWNDIRMGAPMETILTGYNDPRIEPYFLPVEDTTFVKTNKYKGIRNGVDLVAKSNYQNHSSKIGSVVAEKNMQWMTAAEVYFLKAEAALRGWSGAGNAKDNYELGVKKSFSQYGLSNANTYLSDDTSTPSNYTDAKNPEYNIEALSDVKIAYDETASKEKQLEQIITQKWIAMFPDGMEAWSEYRRTGYPKIFPVFINNSGGTIDTDIQVRRLAFINLEYSTNTEEVTKAVSYLKGPDNGGTRLWWDVGANKF